MKTQQIQQVRKKLKKRKNLIACQMCMADVRKSVLSYVARLERLDLGFRCFFMTLWIYSVVLFSSGPFRSWSSKCLSVFPKGPLKSDGILNAFDRSNGTIHCLILTSSVIKSEKVSICRYTQYSVRICKISTNSFQSVESGVKVVLTRRQNDPCSCHWGLWFPRIACC